MPKKCEQEQHRCWDFLRVAAQLLVVLGHVALLYGGQGVMTPMSVSDSVAALAEWIYKFHMPLYMLISGCVYAACRREGKYEQGENLLVKKAHRLLKPYFLWGCFYVGPVLVICRRTDSWNSYITDLLLYGSDCSHLWFLLALFWIFIWVRCTEPLTQRYPLFGLALSLLLWGISTEALELPLRLSESMYYQLYFALGVWLSNHYDRIAPFLRRFWWLGFLFALPLFLLQTSNSISKLLAGLSGCAMALTFTIKLAPWLIRLEKNQLYLWLKEFTFPLYLVHPMVFYLVVYSTGNRFWNPWGMVLGLTALMYGGFLLIWFLRERLCGPNLNKF